MKKFLKIIIILGGLLVIVIISTIALFPWMDRWGATDAEILAVYPGDELFSNPAMVNNRAITIEAAPEDVYPWLVQMGADKGGFYSYTLLESIAFCPMKNADRIHPDWQNLQPGDVVKMCPKDAAPPPYIVAQVTPSSSLVLGHKNDQGDWEEVWEFNLIGQADGSTRMVQRTRSKLSGGIWEGIRPVIFLMQRGMLIGIKTRAEGM